MKPELTDDAKVRSIAARLERQTALYDTHKSFYFVICEHVLRWRIGAPAMMGTQMDRLVSPVPTPQCHHRSCTSRPTDANFPMTCFSAHDTG